MLIVLFKLNFLFLILFYDIHKLCYAHCFFLVPTRQRLSLYIGTPQQITYATMGANLTGFGNLSGFKPRILFLASSHKYLTICI
jgi:hypothetical protein